MAKEMDSVYMREGPWFDNQGRPCLGIWADEGGQLLIVRRELTQAVSFHVVGPAGHEQRASTLARFRLQRLIDFLQQDTLAAGKEENGE